MGKKEELQRAINALRDELMDVYRTEIILENSKIVGNCYRAYIDNGKNYTKYVRVEYVNSSGILYGKVFDAGDNNEWITFYSKLQDLPNADELKTVAEEITKEEFDVVYNISLELLAGE